MFKLIEMNLHRVRHKNVRKKVIRFIEKHWASGSEARIITGNSSIMRNIVMEVLDEYKLCYQIDHPFDPCNKGYIVIWLE